MNHQSKEKLENLLQELISFRNAELDAKDFSVDRFKDFISKSKNQAQELISCANDILISDQLMEIVKYKVYDEKSAFQQFLIRYILPDKHARKGLDWQAKGKYVFDLNCLEMKLKGIIYKIENLLK